MLFSYAHVFVMSSHKLVHSKKPLCLPMYGAYLPQYTKDEIQGEGVFQEVKNGVLFIGE